MNPEMHLMNWLVLLPVGNDVFMILLLLIIAIMMHCAIDCIVFIHIHNIYMYQMKCLNKDANMAHTGQCAVSARS